MADALEMAGPSDVVAAEPRVRLVAYTHDPFGLAVASARTCYAADFVYVGQLTPKGERTRTNLEEALPDHGEELARIGDPRTDHQDRVALVSKLQEATHDPATRDALAVFADLARQRTPTDARIAQSIYEAGHHTPFQHPTFVFALEGVSRNVVESFFHQHMFYNSEQQSQRYVKMGEASVHVPASVQSDPDALRIYEGAVAEAWAAYHDLRERLVDENIKVMAAIGGIKGHSEKKIRSEAEKKSQEMARYVIPIAASTKLYHTVSGIVLMRYIRMANIQNAPAEARQVVDRMVDAVKEVDPAFFEKLQESPRDKEDFLEWRLSEGAAPPVHEHGILDGVGSRLLHFTEDGPARVAQVVREVTGTTMPDDILLHEILDPEKNPVWNDTLNTWDHSPVLRALRHVHYTFHKRLSLTAYAQDQRHRTTPATRPLLQRCIGQVPDVYCPDVIAAAPDAKDVFDHTIDTLWDAMVRLRDQHGIPAEDCAYLLPNATNIYYTQSGDLLSWIHKWRLRLCFNAQKEIFQASLDELRQVQAVHPQLTGWLGPPCSFIAAALPEELQDDVDACCPEGPRWCGVKVWKNFDARSGKPKRPY